MGILQIFTLSNLTVSPLTITTEYALVQSNPDGITVTDKVIVYVYQLDLDVYKPKFIAGTEPKVPETLEELAKGLAGTDYLRCLPPLRNSPYYQRLSASGIAGYKNPGMGSPVVFPRNQPALVG